MPELRKFAVFSASGRVGTLAAPARFLDARLEKSIQLDSGEEILVSSDALEVQPDGSFFLHSSIAEKTKDQQPSSIPVETQQPVSAAPVNNKALEDKLYRDGYSIERVKVDRLISEPAAQRQEGDTLILPVIEEVFVVEKRMMLREEIRITRVRDEVKEARTINPSVQS